MSPPPCRNKVEDRGGFRERREALPGGGLVATNLNNVPKKPIIRLAAELAGLKFTAAADELTRDRAAMSPEATNREVYRLLKEGIPVSVMDADSAPGHPSSGLRAPFSRAEKEISAEGKS